MALTRQQKQAQLSDLTDKMRRAQSVIFAHYIGLCVADVSKLRRSLREKNAEMKVGKKTLICIAAKEAGLPTIEDDTLDGPVSCIFSFGDPLSGAQIAFKFAKDHDKVALIGGIFDGKILTRKETIELAKMSNREVLLATFMSMLRSPLVQFASMCNSPLVGFTRAMSELAKKKGST